MPYQYHVKLQHVLHVSRRRAAIATTATSPSSSHLRGFNAAIHNSGNVLQLLCTVFNVLSSNSAILSCVVWRLHPWRRLEAACTAADVATTAVMATMDVSIFTKRTAHAVAALWLGCWSAFTSASAAP